MHSIRTLCVLEMCAVDNNDQLHQVTTYVLTALKHESSQNATFARLVFQGNFGVPEASVKSLLHQGLLCGAGDALNFCGVVSKVSVDCKLWLCCCRLKEAAVCDGTP